MECQMNTHLKDVPNTHANNQQITMLGNSTEFGRMSKHDGSHFVGQSKTYFVTTLQQFPTGRLRSGECTCYV